MSAAAVHDGTLATAVGTSLWRASSQLRKCTVTDHMMYGRNLTWVNGVRDVSGLRQIKRAT